MQDQVVDRFAKVLGDEFVMLRNAIFPGVEVAVPLILVGPFGLRVMDTTAIRGTYRAKGDQWMVLDSGGSFKSSRPNLAAHLRLYGEMVRRSLSSRGLMMPEVEPVLIVARPEAYVENIKSPIRVVLADGVENFATNLGTSRALFPPRSWKMLSRHCDPPLPPRRARPARPRPQRRAPRPPSPSRRPQRNPRPGAG